MAKLISYLKRKPMALLFLALPLAILAGGLGWEPIWSFVFSSLAVVPLAGYIGEATEELVHYTGPRLGGLLNATLGNAAELIITFIAIREGLLELVKASITGSILGNLLLVLGMAMVIGGLRNGVQTFDRRQATSNAVLLVMTVITLMVPSLLSHFISFDESNLKVEALSLGTAAVMMLLYILGLVYSFKYLPGPLTPEPTAEAAGQPTWSLRTSLFVLALSTVGVAYMSEILVGSVEPVIQSLGISEFFVGIIFIPIIGNVAEHLVAVQVAARNRMTLSVEIAVSSSLQVALFVAPVLVFVSLFFGHPLTLIFNELELVALIAGVIIAALVSADGESNWFEGAELLGIYLILGLAFFLIPF